MSAAHVAVGGVADLPRRRLRRGGRRRRCREQVYEQLAVDRGAERDDRPRRGLLRRRPTATWACWRPPRRARAGRAAPAAGARLQPRHGRDHLAGAHRLRVRARWCAQGRAGDPAARPALAEAATSWPSGSGMPALLGRIRGCCRRAARAAPLPDGLSEREAEILRLVAQGLVEPRDRPHAAHQRAHGCQPHPQHPAQDRLREPHRGGRLCAHARPDGARMSRSESRDATLCDRTQLRGAARPDRRGRAGDRGHQRRRGRALAVLVPERRPPPLVLPLRGAVAGRRSSPRPGAPTCPPTQVVEVSKFQPELVRYA